jgi:ABC-type phosphate transport system substrate-binding protein
VSPESWQKRLGFGTTVAWPAISGASDAVGNSGMVEKIAATPYSVGYVGVSFHDEIAKAALGTAALQSYDGEFLLPTPQAIEAAAAALWPRTPPDERLTLVNAPGANAYPLIIMSMRSSQKSSRARRPRRRCAVSYCGRLRPTKPMRDISPTRISFRCPPTSGCSVTTRLKK